MQAKKTRVKQQMLNWLMGRKKYFVISILSAVVTITIYLAQFTNALQSLYSFFVQPEKTQTIQQKIEKSPGSIQAGRDVNIKVEPNVPSATPPPIARFSFDLQISKAKERIRYLSQEYLKTDRMSLVEVKGVYGDNVLDSPQFYDWDKVMNELEKQGYIKILQQTNDNIIFKVLKQFSESQVNAQVRIITPKDGDEVPRYIVVRGQSSLKLNKGEYLWLIVNPIPSPGEWWLQGPINPNPQSGKWNVEAWFGKEKGDIGYEFDITVILVTEKDNMDYYDYIKRKETKISQFPKNGTIVDSVIVTRK